MQDPAAQSGPWWTPNLRATQVRSDVDHNRLPTSVESQEHARQVRAQVVLAAVIACRLVSAHTSRWM